MRTRHLLGPTLATAFLTACAGGDADSADADSGSESDLLPLIVDNRMDACRSEAGGTLCPRAMRDGATDWEQVVCGITGLAFQWGTTYSLTVADAGYQDPTIDGCGQAYALVSVDVETFDGGGLAFTLDSLQSYQVEAAEGGGTLDGYPFTCASAEVCDAMAAALGQDAVDLSLQNPEAAGEPLLLTAVQ